MTGSGNDFVMVDARLSGPDEWSAADMRAACARGTGVGADGLVFVAPGSTPGSARMTYFNSDGSHAAMCGNAALCATRLAARLGLAPAAGMRLETDAGVFEGRCLADDHPAELRLAPADPPRAVPGLATVHGERRAVLGIVGVPHLVVLVDDVDTVDLERRGRALRNDRALGPPGANVNFISPGPRPSQWRMRTYERGVEGETLACGTGAVTAALAVEGWALGRLPTTIITRGGQRLEVSGGRTDGGSYDEIWLSGEARLVFRGVLT